MQMLDSKNTTVPTTPLQQTVQVPEPIGVKGMHTHT